MPPILHVDRVMRLRGVMYHMEKLCCCMNFLNNMKLDVDVIVTDKHKQINKWLQEMHP